MLSLGRQLTCFNVLKPQRLISAIHSVQVTKLSSSKCLIPSMGPKRMTKTLRTKSSAKKRFRVTGSGHIKCWPSRLHGKALIIKRRGISKLRKHLRLLLPNSGFKLSLPSTSKSPYLIEDREFDGI